MKEEVILASAQAEEYKKYGEATEKAAKEKAVVIVQEAHDVANTERAHYKKEIDALGVEAHGLRAENQKLAEEASATEASLDALKAEVKAFRAKLNSAF